MELEDAINMAILTLKEGFDGEITDQNIEIGIVNNKTNKFQILTPSQIKGKNSFPFLSSILRILTFFFHKTKQITWIEKNDSFISFELKILKKSNSFFAFF